MAMDVIDSTCLLYTSLLSAGKQKQEEGDTLMRVNKPIFANKDADHLRVHRWECGGDVDEKEIRDFQGKKKV